VAPTRRLRIRVADALQSAAGPDGAYAGGRKLMKLRRYSEAAEGFAQAERQYSERLAANHPRVVDALAQRAWCLVAMDDVTAGIAAYRHALELKSSSGDSDPPSATELRGLLADAERRKSLGTGS
jgi:tetratricopeptide (TPR) repeat protein